MQIYGMVGGFKHDGGWIDCSMPCMFLQGDECRMKGGKAACAAKDEDAAPIWHSRVGIEHCNSGLPWSDWEIAMLRDGATDMAASVITGRKVSAVRCKRKSIGISAGTKGYQDLINESKGVFDYGC